VKRRRGAALAALATVGSSAVAALGLHAQPQQPTGLPLLALTPHGNLQTAVFDPDLTSSNAPRHLARIRAAGASAVRFSMSWAAIAPRGAQRPAGFHAANPADPHYRWTGFDALLKLVVAQGLQPLVVIASAPVWAEGKGDGPQGTRRPDANELGLFARAAATRYSGTFQGLPRIRYWQIWNEPNYFAFLSPQVAGGKLVAGNWYRRMLNAAAASIHAVKGGNVVITAGYAPFGVHGSFGASPPLEFMRQMLCMTGRTKPVAACSTRSEFDVWAHHPYTLGNPLHRAQRVDDVSLPELPMMQRLLAAAWRAGHIKARRAPPLWVTEISWDTKPPDPKGVPTRLQARWTAEALYRLWRTGVPFVTWFQLQDDPMTESHFQSGLYFHNGRPKLTMLAFRFPFVALKVHGRVFVWGRTPNNRRETVLVQQQVAGHRWRSLRTLRANRFGVFNGPLKASLRGSFRAVLKGRGASLAYLLKAPPDMPLTSPFGT